MTCLRRISWRCPLVPFAGIAVLAFAVVCVSTAETSWGLVAADAGLAAAVAAMAALVPWRRTPAVVLLAFPVACDAVIGVLRHAQGGNGSGYGALAILPVLWAGLQLPRWTVAVTTASTALLFSIPIVLVGAPMYPATSWRAVVLWPVVAAVVGLATSFVVADQRRHALIASDRARELDRLVATQAAIATAHYEPDAVMSTVVAEALKLTDADGATIELPEGDKLVARAAAGTAEAHLGLELALDRTISGRAFTSGDVIVCDDTETDPRVDLEACRRLGARSLVVVPLPGENQAAGVLRVYSGAPGAFTPADARALSALAAMIGVALVRADLVHRLAELASVDELTGLANRRAWYRTLDEALGRARRSGRPLSVVLLDLDGLKDVNDRNGHQAGDRLLAEVARRWAGVLRPGDLLGRVGGDEFAVLLEGADDLAAQLVIARLERSLVSWHHASAGSATWDGSEDGAELVMRADADMYRHKRASRSRRTALAAGRL